MYSFRKHLWSWLVLVPKAGWLSQITLVRVCCWLRQNKFTLQCCMCEKEIALNAKVYAYKEWARDQGNDCSWKHEGPTLKQSLSLGISHK
ncbi:hypothetical protein ACFXTH_028577 [Malus domestica]